MRAVLQVADTGPLESLVYMLRKVGWEVALPSLKLRDELRGIGCTAVLEIDSLVRNMGYERPMPLPESDAPGDVLIDVKAHLNFDKIQARWPGQRMLWYRINGAAPETDPKFKEEPPPCPVLTPNQHYAGRADAYAFWPHFARFEQHMQRDRLPCDPPVCLVHNLTGWGYGAMVPSMRALGVRMYGQGSPDGLVPHHDVYNTLANSLCMVHLKSNDAPGYALLEAMASACPVVCTRRLIWRCRMEELLEPGVTCLAFDKETHDPLDVEDCAAEVQNHLRWLEDLEHNRWIGEAGRTRLLQLMWKDVEGLRRFLECV